VSRLIVCATSRADTAVTRWVYVRGCTVAHLLRIRYSHVSPTRGNVAGNADAVTGGTTVGVVAAQRRMQRPVVSRRAQRRMEWSAVSWTAQRQAALPVFPTPASLLARVPVPRVSAALSRARTSLSSLPRVPRASRSAVA
jgi:hypothetical protein